MTLQERLIYGDRPESGLTDAQANNLLGKLYRHYDEAGLTTLAACDFKGNVLWKVRRVIRDEQILSVFNTAPPTGNFSNVTSPNRCSISIMPLATSVRLPLPFIPKI